LQSNSAQLNAPLAMVLVKEWAKDSVRGSLIAKTCRRHTRPRQEELNQERPRQRGGLSQMFSKFASWSLQFPKNSLTCAPAIDWQAQGQTKWPVVFVLLPVAQRNVSSFAK
jgi:hypothetical protein